MVNQFSHFPARHSGASIYLFISRQCSNIKSQLNSLSPPFVFCPIQRVHSLSSPPMSSTPPNEHTALLNGDGVDINGSADQLPFSRRVLRTVKAEGEPSWIDSYKFFLFGSWINVLLILVPFSFASHWANWDAALRFSFSFIAILPLAKASFALS